MSEYKIIFQVLGVLLALFFIFLTYMNTKSWRWVHVTFTFFVFVASIVFLMYAAMALKTRSTWIRLHDTLAREVDKENRAVALLRDGDPNDLEGKDSVTTARHELAREVIDRGRVWRETVPTIGADNSINVSTTPPVDPNVAAGAAAAPTKNDIAKNAILYVFRETMDPATGRKLPTSYLGEFRVEAATDTSVQLVPTLPLTQQQGQEIRTPNTTWTLYEVEPLDGYEFYAGLDEAALRNLLPQAAMGVTPQKYEQILQQYVRTGQEATDTDPPENVWIELKFIKTHTVQVDAAAMLETLSGSPYDTLGQAQIVKLAAGEAAEFSPGDIAIFDKQTAEDLVASGVAEKVRLLYFRRLHDYEREFHLAYQRTTELANRLKDLQRDIDTIKLATDKANMQIALQEADKTKLNDDVEKAQFEQAELDKYAQALVAQLGAVRSRVNQLYRSNKALSKELTAITTRLTNEINTRSKVTSVTP
jgi:hypothetical protein